MARLRRLWMERRFRTGVLLAAAGVVALVASPVIAWRQWRMHEAGLLAEGTVRDMRTTSGGTRYSPHWELQVEFAGRDGAAHSFWEDVGQGRYAGTMPGAHVTVAYDPEDPSIADIRWSGTRGNWWVTPLLALLGAGVLGVAGVLMVRSAVRLSRDSLMPADDERAGL